MQGKAGSASAESQRRLADLPFSLTVGVVCTSGLGKWFAVCAPAALTRGLFACVIPLTAQK